MPSEIHAVAETRPVTYRIGDVEVIPSCHCVRRGGGVTYLRPKTADLLLYLVEHRDRVVTKQDLIAGIWKNAAVTDNALVQCVTEVRRVLGDDPRMPRLVRTFPKVGYQFVGAVEESVLETPVAVPPPPAAAKSSFWKITPVAVAFFAALLALFSNSGVPSTASLGRAEAAWWRFGPNRSIAEDSTGRLPGGIATGSITRVDGASFHALQFDGNSSYLAGFTRGALPSGAAPRTIAAFVKAVPNGDSAGIFHYGTKGSTPYSASFALLITDRGNAAAGNLWVGEFVHGSSVVADGRWHHVAAVFEGQTTNLLRLYVDGAEEGRTVLTHSTATGKHGDWAIGRLLESSASLRGAVGDVRVYPRAMTPAELRALLHCTSAPAQLTIGRRPMFLLPLWPDRPPATAAEASVDNPSTDLAGVQFAARTPDCAARSLRGADVGQDLRIEADVSVPLDPHGYGAEAGPYFRSRRAPAGDGILGGTSAGYWVMLHSSGEVKVRCLNPSTVVAFSPEIDGFNANATHHLRADAAGNTLRVWLDGAAITFDQNGRRDAAVEIPPLWNNAAPPGVNQGAAGIAFSCWNHRDCQGRQSAKSIAVTSLREGQPSE